MKARTARKTKTAQDLKEKAARLLEQAKRIENDRLVRLGKVVDKYLQNDFADFDLSKFKDEISKI